MSTHDSWKPALGDWAGTTRLIMPGENDRMSPATASVGQIAKGNFCVIDYTWVFEGEAQEGRLTLGFVPDDQAVEAVFLDSWHMGHKLMMPMRGQVSGNVTNVAGSYQVPGSPDWGWRIEIEPGDGSGWKLMMYNVSPDGESYPGFEINAARK